MNTTSNFPDSIDDRVFVSDVSIDTLNIYNKHQEYIQNNEYALASRFLRDNINTCLNADLLNYFEDALYKIEKYLLEKDCSKVIHHHDNKEPSLREGETITTPVIWDGSL